MRTLVDNAELIRKAHAFYRDSSRAWTFEDATQLLSRVYSAVVRSGKNSAMTGTQEWNSDPTVKLVIQGMVRHAYDEHMADLPISDYIDARDWCEHGYERRHRPGQSPLEARDYETASMAQDACNGSGIAHTLAHIAQHIEDDCMLPGRREADGGAWRHPITVLYLTQMQHLAGGADTVFDATAHNSQILEAGQSEGIYADRANAPYQPDEAEETVQAMS